MTGSTQGTNGRSEPRPERGRFSSRRKAEAVLRLLHGEELDALSRELGVTAATLAQWRERFLAAPSSFRQRGTAPRAAPKSLRLHRSHLRDQRPPASGEELRLLGQRDVSLAAAANAKVVSQFIERGAESRR